MTRASSFDDPRYVKALSHPLRVRILAMLQERQATPRELSGWLGVSLSTTSYHVRTLAELGIIKLVRTTQVRGAIAHHYRAVERPRVSDRSWEQASPVARQAAIGATLQAIDAYVRPSAEAGGFEREEAMAARHRLRLDEQGWEQAAAACRAFIENLAVLEAAAADRLAEDPHAEGASDAALALMLFERLHGEPDGG